MILTRIANLSVILLWPTFLISAGLVTAKGCCIVLFIIESEIRAHVIPTRIAKESVILLWPIFLISAGLV